MIIEGSDAVCVGPFTNDAEVILDVEFDSATNFTVSTRPSQVAGLRSKAYRDSLTSNVQVNFRSIVTLNGFQFSLTISMQDEDGNELQVEEVSLGQLFDGNICLC